MDVELISDDEPLIVLDCVDDHEAERNSEETESAGTSELEVLNKESDDNERSLKNDIDTTKEESDEGTFCNICMECWTSSGCHRISSLKCGHFFGFECIDRWLKASTSNGCPTCNEKCSRRDIRSHYVSKLKAIDTGERDRALNDLEKERSKNRALEIHLSTLRVQVQLQSKEIELLKSQISSQSRNSVEILKNLNSCDTSHPMNETNNACMSSASTTIPSSLALLKRLEIIRQPSQHDRDRSCRVMVYSEHHSMLIVSQPTFTSLTPGFGVRRINMLDTRLGSLIPLHKEPIRDMVLNAVRPDHLLTASQDNMVKLTNVVSCCELQRFKLESEVWAVCWHHHSPSLFFAATKRGQIFLYDTTADTSSTTSGVVCELVIPVGSRRPIIGLQYVPRKEDETSFPLGGLLVLTLDSLWFFEEVENLGTEMSPNDDSARREFKINKIHVAAGEERNMLFWSVRVDLKSRLVLLTTKPMSACPSRAIVIELTLIISEDNTVNPSHLSSHQVSFNKLLDCPTGITSANCTRSFLRPALFSKPEGEDMYISYVSVVNSERTGFCLTIRALSTERVLCQVNLDGPGVDVCPLEIGRRENSSLEGHGLIACLLPNHVWLYKWM